MTSVDASDHPSSDWREGVGPLTDGTVVLRPVVEADVDELARTVRASAVSIGRWMPWAKPDHDADDVRAFVRDVRRGDELAFTIRVDDGRAAGPVVGTCGLNLVSHRNRTANLGYWLGDHGVGRGLATRAARLVILWGADVLGLRRCEIITAVGNDASRAVAVRLGLGDEGVRRDALRLRGVQHDVHVHAALRDDVERLRSVDPATLVSRGPVG